MRIDYMNRRRKRKQPQPQQKPELSAEEKVKKWAEEQKNARDSSSSDSSGSA